MADISFEHVTKRHPGGIVAIDDLTLDVNDGEFLILVGPSGCGKTTALRSVAGLEPVTEGTIRIGGAVVNDVSPRDRDVAMVFQSYGLYPHLTVARNIGFPLRMAHVPKDDRERRVREAARLLGIEELLDRKPGKLSGGQRQRVAMGRAIVRQPQAFLMDEPLSNLDAKLRVQMRAELVKLHRSLGITTLYVTHDQVEAMTLGDRVAVMRDGLVQQVDTARMLYYRPTNTYVASFLGSPPMNFLRGRVDGGDIYVGSCSAPAPPHFRANGSELLIGVRPESLTIANEADGGLRFPVLVELVEDLGSETVVYARAEDDIVAEVADRPMELRGTLAVRLPARHSIVAGARVSLRPELPEAHLFDAGNGKRLGVDEEVSLAEGATVVRGVGE